MVCGSDIIKPDLCAKACAFVGFKCTPMSVCVCICPCVCVRVCSCVLANYFGEGEANMRLFYIGPTHHDMDEQTHAISLHVQTNTRPVHLYIVSCHSCMGNRTCLSTQTPAESANRLLHDARRAVDVHVRVSIYRPLSVTQSHMLRP